MDDIQIETGLNHSSSNSAGIVEAGMAFQSAHIVGSMTTIGKGSSKVI